VRLPAWVAALAARWRSRAEERTRIWAHDPVASTLLSLADEIEYAAEVDGAAGLTVAEAAAESGYSEAHLRDLAHDGVLPLVNETGPMRVRRGHLPRKPGVGVADVHLSSATRDLAAGRGK
jgi:hypothetical protein